MKIAALCIVLLITGCGKVGEPLPPFIRVPETVNDLAAIQNGNELVLTWTNPPKYIDGSTATDLARVRILSDEAILMTVEVTEAAKPQSVVIPVGSALGVPRSFAVLVETRGGKMSQLSNSVSISPVAVPGRVGQLTANVDQRRITLTWDRPLEHPELAESYRVSRIEPAESQVVTDPRYEDTRYRPRQMYTYEVTAMHGMVAGVGPEIVSVLIEDKTPPQTPHGGDIVVSEIGAFVTWSTNTETDFAGYRVFRNGMAVSERPIMSNSYFDPEYRPGFEYAVSALDEFGNESMLSPAIKGQ